MKLFVTCAPGVEGLLAEELRRLGATHARVASRGVEATGAANILWRANVESRLAERVLVPISSGPGGDPESVYKTAAKVDWSRYLPRGKTFAIDASVGASKLNHRVFVSQKIKDAIVDRLRKARGDRPSVDPKRPDVWIRARLYKDRLSLSWDASGHALHQRGYRREAGEAPLRETLAAAVLLAAGFDGSEGLLDPMCGAGTLVIEGAQIAQRIPPGLRKAQQGRFAFQQRAGFDERGFAQYLEELESLVLPEAAHRIVGSDRDTAMVAVARRNAERGGVADSIRWNQGDFKERSPLEPRCLLVANPPYGQRLSEQGRAEALVKGLGDHLKSAFAGHRAAMILGNNKLVGAVGLRPNLRLPVRFAKLDARIVVFELYEGSRRG